MISLSGLGMKTIRLINYTLRAAGPVGPNGLSLPVIHFTSLYNTTLTKRECTRVSWCKKIQVRGSIVNYTISHMVTLYKYDISSFMLFATLLRIFLLQISSTFGPPEPVTTAFFSSVTNVFLDERGEGEASELLSPPRPLCGFSRTLFFRDGFWILR